MIAAQGHVLVTDFWTDPADLRSPILTPEQGKIRSFQFGFTDQKDKKRKYKVVPANEEQKTLLGFLRYLQGVLEAKGHGHEPWPYVHKDRQFVIVRDPDDPQLDLDLRMARYAAVVHWVLKQS